MCSLIKFIPVSSIDGWIDEWMGFVRDGWILFGHKNGWMNEWIDFVWLYGWMDGWMGFVWLYGWMDLVWL